MKKLVPFVAGIAASAVSFAAIQGPAAADEVSDFFSKARIKVIIGFNPGGGFDRGGRVVARHLHKYIPGSPKMIAQNMPGGGSIRLLNWLQTKGPKDGTAIGHFHPAALREAYIGAAGAFFKPRELY